jgi:hypothetical protein
MAKSAGGPHCWLTQAPLHRENWLRNRAIFIFVQAARGNSRCVLFHERPNLSDFLRLAIDRARNKNHPSPGPAMLLCRQWSEHRAPAKKKPAEAGFSRCLAFR